MGSSSSRVAEQSCNEATQPPIFMLVERPPKPCIFSLFFPFFYYTDPDPRFPVSPATSSQEPQKKKKRHQKRAPHLRNSFTQTVSFLLTCSLVAAFRLLLGLEGGGGPTGSQQARHPTDSRHGKKEGRGFLETIRGLRSQFEKGREREKRRWGDGGGRRRDARRVPVDPAEDVIYVHISGFGARWRCGEASLAPRAGERRRSKSAKVLIQDLYCTENEVYHVLLGGCTCIRGCVAL